MTGDFIRKIEGHCPARRKGGIYEIAKAVAEGKSPTNISNNVNAKCIMSENCPQKEDCVNLMIGEVKERFYSGGMTTGDDKGKPTGSVTWKELLENKYTVNDKNMSLFIYGLALHNLTDIFAHSSFQPGSTTGSWSRIIHADGADNIDVVPGRYSCASYISKLLVEHIIKKEVGSINDFFNLITSSVFTGDFRLGNLSECIKAIDENYFNIYKITIERMSFWEAIK